MKSGKNYQSLKFEWSDNEVLTLRLNRPEIRNAFNEKMIEELTEIFSLEVKKPGIKAIVLRGEGPVFSAGGDLNWMKKSIDLNFEENLEDTRKLTRMFTLMNECPKPLIGVIHGAAIGGGVGLVSVCDIAIASSETQFSLSEVRLGIVPACIGPFVVSKIGASHARGLFMSAERFSTARAKEVGLIHESVNGPPDLDDALSRILGNVLLCGQGAMAAAKKLILDLSWPEKRKSIGDPYEYVSRLLAELRVSEEGQEGLRAFLEKRKPKWLGKKL